MPTYPFLSPEWLVAAEQIRTANSTAGNAIAVSVKMNLIVEEVPFGDGHLDAHLDTSSGHLELGVGHLETPDVKVNLDYATAKAMLIDGDTQAGMTAFMAGKVRVDGDMTKLLSFQAEEPSERQLRVSDALRAITA